MRISDWSSDVCSSDLNQHDGEISRAARNADPCRQPDMCGGRQIAHLAAADDDQPGRDDADRRGHALDDAQRIYPRLWTAQLIVERDGDDEIGRASCRERVCEYG